MAWRRTPFPPVQRTRPALGWSRPWQIRMRTLLPAPLGPRITVRGPAPISPEMRSRIHLPFTTNVTPSRTSGSTLSPVAPRGDVLEETRRGVENDDETDQHDAEAQRQWQVSFARPERDGSRHDAR